MFMYVMYNVLYEYEDREGNYSSSLILSCIVLNVLLGRDGVAELVKRPPSRLGDWVLIGWWRGACFAILPALSNDVK